MPGLIETGPTKNPMISRKRLILLSRLQKSNFKGARVFQPAILSLLAGKKTRPPLLLHRLKVLLQLPLLFWEMVCLDLN